MGLKVFVVWDSFGWENRDFGKNAREKGIMNRG